MAFLTGLIKGVASSLSRNIQADLDTYKNDIRTFGAKLFDTKQSNYQKYIEEFNQNKKTVNEITNLLNGDTSATQYLIDTTGSLSGALAQAQLIGQKVTESGGMLHPVNDFIKIARKPNVNISVEQLAQTYTTPYKTMPLGPMKPQGTMRFFDDDMSDNITSISNRLLDVSGIPQGEFGGGDKIKKAYDLAGTRGIRVWELNAPTDHGERASYLQNAAFVARRKALDTEGKPNKRLLLEAAEIQHAADQASILHNLENKTELSRSDRDKIKNNFLERLSIVHGTVTDKMYQMGSFVTGGMEATQLDILTEVADNLMQQLDIAMKAGVSYAEANYNINEAIRQNKVITYSSLEDELREEGVEIPSKVKIGPEDTYLKGQFVMSENLSLVDTGETYGKYYGGAENIPSAIGALQGGKLIFGGSMFAQPLPIDVETAAILNNSTISNAIQEYQRSNVPKDKEQIKSKIRSEILKIFPDKNNDQVTDMVTRLTT
tara:strand:- start:5307 stop:6776 length:1470 start_codon:yes stop_codon:yes gene_type:complete